MLQRRPTPAIERTAPQKDAVPPLIAPALDVGSFLLPKAMYVFISYSSKDQMFARSLEESLTLLGVPVFLDERQIKIGDSITARVFEALGRASHILYIVSGNSLKSKWVQEELAAAKMRQLSDKGCKILPLLIEDVELPASMAHIKYADFRNWELRESYLGTLRNLLEAMGVQSSNAPTLTEMQAFSEHISDLVRIKGFADSIAQAYFQLERAWHSIGGDQKCMTLYNWFKETADKTCSFDSFLGAGDAIRSSINSAEGAGGERWEKLHSQFMHVAEDFTFFHKPRGDDVYFRQLIKAEVNARQLSAVVFSVLSETAYLLSSKRWLATSNQTPAPDC